MLPVSFGVADWERSGARYSFLTRPPRWFLSLRQSFTELPKGPIPETVTKVLVETVIEGKASERPARLELLRYLASEKKLPAASLEYALAPTLEFLTDVAIDAPNAEG